MPPSSLPIFPQTLNVCLSLSVRCLCECRGSAAVESPCVLINRAFWGKPLTIDSSSAQWTRSSCATWMPIARPFLSVLFLQRKGGYCSVNPIRCWSPPPPHPLTFFAAFKDTGLVLTRWAMVERSIALTNSLWTPYSLPWVYERNNRGGMPVKTMEIPMLT